MTVENERTWTMGYRMRRVAPIVHPHFTRVGSGSGNCPLLHLVITKISVITVARRSQQCWPIRTARLQQKKLAVSPTEIEMSHSVQGGVEFSVKEKQRREEKPKGPTRYNQIDVRRKAR